MSLEDRVRQLQEDREKKSVDQLLQNVAQQESVEEVVIDGETVIISTDRFTSEHTVTKSYGRYKMEGGEYQFESDGVSATFSTATTRDDVLNAVAVVLAAQETDADASPPADPDPMIDTDRVTVTQLP